jgi:hypothetical protein
MHITIFLRYKQACSRDALCDFALWQLPLCALAWQCDVMTQMRFTTADGKVCWNKVGASTVAPFSGMFAQFGPCWPIGPEDPGIDGPRLLGQTGSAWHLRRGQVKMGFSACRIAHAELPLLPSSHVRSTSHLCICFKLFKLHCPVHNPSDLSTIALGKRQIEVPTTVACDQQVPLRVVDAGTPT